MHIAFLNPQGNFDPTDRGWTEHPDFGGQLVYVKEVALAMANRGHTIDIITRQIIDKDWPEFADDLDSYTEQKNVRILRFPCGPEHFLPKEKLWPYLYDWSENIFRFYTIEGHFPDALTGHYGDGGLAAALLKEKMQIPFTFTSHSLGAQKMNKFIRNRDAFSEMVDRFQFHKRIAAERVSILKASRIITSSKLEQVEQYGHIVYHGSVDPSDEKKFAVIPPGVNLKVFGLDQHNEVENQIAERVEKMLKRDIPANRHNLPLVICSSRLDHKKNHINLVKAWAVSKKLRDAANLAIIIQGSSDPLRQRKAAYKNDKLQILDKIVKIIDEHNLWPCITAFELKNQAELAACYHYLAKNNNGIFALTTYYEPFGLAPLEAMAAGLPAVVTKNGGPSESLQDENNRYGILIDPHDPQDIALGLTELALQPKRWEKMQRAGIQRVKEKYTWDRTADAYLSQIESIRREQDSSQEELKIPDYFFNPNKDDINEKWLMNLYYE